MVLDAKNFIKELRWKIWKRLTKNFGIDCVLKILRKIVHAKIFKMYGYENSNEE